MNVRSKVRVHGVTRSRTPGKDAVGNCTTPVTIPERDSMNMRNWRKIESEGRQLFKLYLPRISERNGPICCYRVYLVKLPPHKTVSDLPPPEEIAVYSYRYAHSSPTGGAYVAETFDSDQLLTEVFLGNGESSNGGAMCDKCVGLRPRSVPPPVLEFVPENPPTTISTSTNANNINATIATTPTPTTTVTSSNTATTTSTMTTVPTTTRTDTTTAVPIISNVTEKIARRKREDSPVQRASVDESAESIMPSQDGFLDETSNYTGFIEVISMYDRKYL